MNTSKRQDKLILAGLFLSKFDKDGLKHLGFSQFLEAYNALALSQKARPASIKNYRDKFDPHFPNKRKRWHKRPLRDHCAHILERYGHLDIDALSILLKSQFLEIDDPSLTAIKEEIDGECDSSFAKRLMTGRAAELYFESNFRTIETFQKHEFINTTALGCEFDYRMVEESSPFLAVEVKGLNEPKGNVQLTSKEHQAAEILGDRFYLFIVRNFI